jgi:large subunit ribosomal protein LX
MVRVKEQETKRFNDTMSLEGQVIHMKAFRATGSFKTGKFTWQKYSIEVAALDEAGAAEKVMSDLGSRHKLKRTEIKIDELRALEANEIENPAVQYVVGGAQ